MIRQRSAQAPQEVPRLCAELCVASAWGCVVEGIGRRRVVRSWSSRFASRSYVTLVHDRDADCVASYIGPTLHTVLTLTPAHTPRCRKAFFERKGGRGVGIEFQFDVSPL